MEFLQTVVIFAVTIFILVTIHEYGHFWVARRCGIKVLRFSIGFGTPLWRHTDRHGTEFVLAVIPFGGYVKMLDEREAPVPVEQQQYAFNRQPLRSRMATVAAGPIANFLLAIVAYWLVFVAGVSGVVPVIDRVDSDSIADMAGLQAGQEIVAVDGQPTPTWEALNLRLLQRIGESGEIEFQVKYPNSDMLYSSTAVLQDWLVGEEDIDLVGGLGMQLYRPAIKPVLDKVMPDSPAERAGMLAGDEIIAVDGLAMADWQGWVEYVRARPLQRLQVELRRDTEILNVPLVPAELRDDQGEAYGQVGVMVRVPEFPPEMLREFQYGPIEALVAAVERSWQMIVFTLDSIKKMIEGLISPKNLSGPITIAKVATVSANSGIESYVSFLALLSISLGVLNLLPIPVLDGGHLLFGLIEGLLGKPVPEKLQMFGYQIGLVMVLSLMVFALYNDIARL